MDSLLPFPSHSPQKRTYMPKTVLRLQMPKCKTETCPMHYSSRQLQIPAVQQHQARIMLKYIKTLTFKSPQAALSKLLNDNDLE